MFDFFSQTKSNLLCLGKCYRCWCHECPLPTENIITAKTRFKIVGKNHYQRKICHKVLNVTDYNTLFHDLNELITVLVNVGCTIKMQPCEWSKLFKKTCWSPQNPCKWLNLGSW